MSIDVVVVQAPVVTSRGFIDYPYHSDLGVVQAAAVLREAGIAVRVADAFALPGCRAALNADGRVQLGASAEVVAADAGEAEVMVVGLTPFHHPPQHDATLANLLDALRARNPDAALILADLYQSGQHYLDYDGHALLTTYPQADGVLRHEAEAVLSSLCETLAGEGRPSEAVVLSGGEVDPFELPVPAWDLVDLEARDAFLRSVVTEIGRSDAAFPLDRRTLPAITSRGCPFDCLHCSSNPGRPQGGAKRQRRLQPDAVHRLVASLAERFGATRIHLLDEMVNADRAHFEHLLDTLAKHRLNFEIPNGMRADRLAPEHLEAMLGRLTTVAVSAESGSQRVVDTVIGKRLDLGHVERVAREAEATGLQAMVHFMIGLPDETREEVNQTLELAIRLWEEHRATPSLQFATPLPGTRLAAVAERAGTTIGPLDDLGPRFQHEPSLAGPELGLEDLRRFKWTFEERIRAGRKPQKVIVNLTYSCNNHCVFCAVGNRSKVHGDFRRQAEALVRYRRQGLDMVDLDGGEPTLYPQLLPMIELARRLGYQRINLTSNGRRCCYPDYARKLVSSGITSMLFSLHGAQALTHGDLVGVPEAFEQTTAGISNCVRNAPAGVELGMNTTLCRSNVDELPEIAQLCWDLGLRWFNIQFLTPFGRATSEVEPKVEQAATRTAEVIDRWRERMKIQVVNLPFCRLPGYEDFLLGDLLKIQRQMVFVDSQDVNLYDYLKEQRYYEERCQGCEFKVFCGGFYHLTETPEPPWRIGQEDLRGR